LRDLRKFENCHSLLRVPLPLSLTPDKVNASRYTQKTLKIPSYDPYICPEIDPRPLFPPKIFSQQRNYLSPTLTSYRQLDLYSTLSHLPHTLVPCQEDKVHLHQVQESSIFDLFPLHSPFPLPYPVQTTTLLLPITLTLKSIHPISIPVRSHPPT